MVNRFVCVDVGTLYGRVYVDRLWHGIKCNSKNPHLTVFTDHPDEYPDMDTVDVSDFMAQGVPSGSVTGRWGRMMIFSPDNGLHKWEPHLYIDVDNVILRDLTPLLNDGACYDFCAHRPWRPGDENGLSASVMSITPGSRSSKSIWDYYHKHKDYREYLTQNMYRYALEDAGEYGNVGWLSRKLIASYKWLFGITTPRPDWCGTLDEAVILCCHGYPKPPDIIEQRLPGWQTVKENWA